MATGKDPYKTPRSDIYKLLLLELILCQNLFFKEPPEPIFILDFVFVTQIYCTSLCLYFVYLYIFFISPTCYSIHTTTPLWNPVLISMNGHKLFNLMLVNIVLLSPSLCPPLPFTVPLKILLDTNMCSQSQKGNYSMTAVACLTWIRVNPIRKATNVTKTLNNAGNGCVNSLFPFPELVSPWANSVNTHVLNICSCVLSLITVSVQGPHVLFCFVWQNKAVRKTKLLVNRCRK